MDFVMSNSQEMLKDSIRKFAEGEIAPKVPHMEETGEVPTDLIEQMAKLNWMGILIPREHGGMGLGNLDRMIMIEEIGKTSAALAMTMQIFHLGAGPILDAGTEEQQAKYLPALAKGEKLATVAITEAGGGSDPVGGTQTTAELQGDEYVLNGRKVFITNSHVADTYIIVAKTGEGSRGLSCFIVDRDMPGFRPGREEHKFGLHGCNTGELIMSDCRVPKENLLGAEGQGLRVALKSIGEIGRPGMAGVALGVMAACVEASAKFAKERVLYGNPIADLQGIQWLLAEMYADLELSRLAAYRAACLIDQHVRADPEIALAKYSATEGAVRSAKKAIDIHGGYGYMTEYPVQRYFRDAECLIASAGTSEVMKIVMARRALA